MQIKDFLAIPEETRRQIFLKAAVTTNLPPQSIEKDWWVTVILQAIYSLDYSNDIQFKGGTSLSKCWGLIERFSEDIDLAINPEILGFTDNLSKNQVSNKLRRAGKSFTTGPFIKNLSDALLKIGIPQNALIISNNDDGGSTQDPVQVFLEYKSLFPEDNYIAPKVMLEITARANKMALTKKEISALSNSTFPIEDLSKIVVTTIKPERTFVEKICLLHEEFKKPEEKIRHERMSRHLFDIYMMCKQGIDKEALQQEKLFTGIIRHRFIYNRIDGVDYNSETPGNFDIIPPGKNLELWRKDYNEMLNGMIYAKDKPTFDDIISRLKELNKALNQMQWNDIPHFQPGEKQTQKENIERYKKYKDAETRSLKKERINPNK